MDFLDAALEDVTDQSEKDATERVPLLLKYAHALMEMQAQNVAQTVDEETSRLRTWLFQDLRMLPALHGGRCKR